MLLRNFRVIALKLTKLFEIWISRHFATKNNLKEELRWEYGLYGGVALLPLILSCKN